MPIIAPDLRWIAKVQMTGQMIEVVEIFESVSLEDLEALAKRLRWKRYGADQQIISHLDESTDVFAVIEGTVRVIIYSPDGKEVAFRDIPAGEYFGELAAIDGLFDHFWREMETFKPVQWHFLGFLEKGSCI